MRLLLFHPQVATRDCTHCQRVLYNEKTGEPERWAGGEYRRHAGCPPPCRTDAGCPKGTPEDPKSLNKKNMQAYVHYLECRATGQFPDDAIVRRNARLIQQVERNAELKFQATIAGLKI